MVTPFNSKPKTMSGLIDIYHGSVSIVEKPLFGAGKLYNDYGRGFYCTEYAELAKEWACSSDSDGYANHYLLDTKGLTVLNLNIFKVFRIKNKSCRHYERCIYITNL